MQFDLNARWAVITEINQVTIAQKSIGKTGKGKGKTTIGRRFYYNNLEDALNGLIDRDINELEKLEEIVDRIAELKQEVQIMLKNVASASPHVHPGQIMSKR